MQLYASARNKERLGDCGRSSFRCRGIIITAGQVSEAAAAAAAPAVVLSFLFFVFYLFNLLSERASRRARAGEI